MHTAYVLRERSAFSEGLTKHALRGLCLLSLQTELLRRGSVRIHATYSRCSSRMEGCLEGSVRLRLVLLAFLVYLLFTPLSVL